MIKRLFVTSVAALSIAAFCLVAATWLFSIHKTEFSDLQVCNEDGVVTVHAGNVTLGDRPKHDQKTVPLPWDGGERVTIEIPVKVTFDAGDTTGAEVTGDSDAVAHIVLREGKLYADHDFRCAETKGLEVHFTGKPVPNWALNGSGDLVLNGVQQDKIQIRLNGSGTITASGAVDELDLAVNGSGNADLGKLTAKRATAKLAGSGDADLDPQDEAYISIAGSGDLRLHNHPPKLDSHITGSGEISEAL